MRVVRRFLVGLVVGASVVLGAAADGAVAGEAASPASWVQVSVATVWYRPSSPRPVDSAALGSPARVESWLDRLTVRERLGLDSRVNTQVLLGEEVVVLGRRQGWSRVEIPEQRGSRYPDGIIGWVPSSQLNATAPPEGRREVIVSATRTWLYAVAAGSVGRRWFAVSYDTELPVVSEVPGYVVLGLPGGREGAVADGAVSPVHVGPVSGAMVVGQARRFLGLPYLWDGTSAFGYDCSGLVYSLYARNGLVLPRDADDQQHAGVAVRLDKLGPGDLLFFAGLGGRGKVHHVAVYVGDGLMIDAPYTGASIEIVPLTSSPVRDEFAGAIRVAGVT